MEEINGDYTGTLHILPGGNLVTSTTLMPVSLNMYAGSAASLPTDLEFSNALTFTTRSANVGLFNLTIDGANLNVGGSLQIPFLTISGSSVATMVCTA